MTILRSKLDASVNHIEESLKGFIESRYVRRVDEYFICYLSSQTGCNRGCKMCHLTATGQTSFNDVNLTGFLTQYLNILNEYKASNIKAKYIHMNFMARGEPLANVHLLNNSSILSVLAENAVKDELRPKFNISTIMPITLTKSLVDIFPIITPTIYYSLYSTNQQFRDKWLPAAMPVDRALRMLKEYQDFSKKIVKIHFPFIKNENDQFNDIMEMCDQLDDAELLYDFNIISFNPISTDQGEESDSNTVSMIHRYLKSRCPGKVKFISRVGQDVMASCGTFYNES